MFLCFVVVFSVTSLSSFQEAERCFEGILRSKGIESISSPLSVILVGNKIDLENERCVSFDQGKALSD